MIRTLCHCGKAARGSATEDALAHCRVIQTEILETVLPILYTKPFLTTQFSFSQRQQKILEIFNPFLSGAESAASWCELMRAGDTEDDLQLVCSMRDCKKNSILAKLTRQTCAISNKQKVENKNKILKSGDTC